MIFIVIAFISTLMIWFCLNKNIVYNLILTLISLETIILSSTLLLSLFHSISTIKYRIVWIIIDILLVSILLLVFRKQKSLFLINYLNFKEKCRIHKHQPIILLFLIFFMVITLISIITIPYNYDSMTYHMARIVHWIQNESILPYATNIERQIYSPVLTEYNIMTTILLHGNDQFANYVQGFSFICNIILVYGVSRKLELNYKSSFFASFIFAMSPMAIAQSFSTQTDEFAALWLMCFIYILLDFFLSDHIVFTKETAMKVFLLSLSLMYGYHSKPTVCFIALISLICLLIKSILSKDKLWDIVKLICIAVPIVVLLLIPQFINNLYLYKTIYSFGTYDHIILDTTDIRFYILNFYKNFSYSLTSGIFPGFDKALVQLGGHLASVLRINIDDPLISVSAPFTTSESIYHHDTATAFIIIALIIISFVIYLVTLISRKKHIDKLYVYYGIFGYLSFFVILTITKWSPWKGRYFIANYAVLIPFIVFMIQNIGSFKKALARRIIIMLIMLSSFYYGVGTLRYHSEFFIQSFEERNDRDEVYYIGRIDYKWPIESTINYIKEKGIADIGLMIESETYEYPLWNSFDDSVRIEHIDVANPYLHKLEHPNFTPQYIMSIDDTRHMFQIGDKYEYNGNSYQCTNFIENTVYLLEKQ